MVSKKSTLLSLLMLCFFSIQMVMATGNTGTITGRMTLANGYIYTVPSSITISATSSAAGLTLADNATATIYIPKNVTLTVNASGRFAGIYIPSNSTLIITGEGTLNAKGGNNTNGANGGNGGGASVWTGSTWPSGNYGHESAGDGGTGGAGGNGGGAGIGGNGGAGGAAKAGPRGVKDRECWKDNNLRGYNAYTGNNGGSGTTMGNLYVMGTVKVTSTTGTQTAPGRSVGADGANATYKWSNRWSAGGGGGGGAGGHGYIAPYGIGGGGAAGGSGSSGASGGFLWSAEKNNNIWNAVGCYGGHGAGYNCSRGIGSWRSQTNYKNDFWNGGSSAYGGYNGSHGGNGTVYRVTATNNNPTVSGASATSTTTSYPAQVQATLSFNANKGTGAAGSRTVYYGVKMDNVAVPTRGDASGSYQFLGYYTSATGGTKVFNADGTPVSVSTIAANTTLYAHWKGTMFTFMNGDVKVKTTTFVTNPEQLDASYTANAGSRPNPYFCGYYTASGIQVFDHNYKLTAAAKATTFEDTETLYAQFISTQHTVVWDYSYRSEENAYSNLDEHARYCRLLFKDASGNEIKTVYLTADEVTNITPSTITRDITTHTTSQMVVDLMEGDPQNNVTTGTNAKIYFTQTQLESMRGYQFDVWTTDGKTTGEKADHWTTATNATSHKTIFSFRKLGENMFWLTWHVTLTDLMMYPEKVYAKPMILVDGKYQEIDQMTGINGEDCYPTSSVGTVGPGSSVTYTGDFPVLINQTGHEAATYKVGMTGFFLAGHEYFLHTTPGNVSDDFISDGSVTNTSKENTLNIDYIIHDYDIPVVLLLPAAPNTGVTDAKINHIDRVLYVDDARVKSVNLSNFHAEREHFNFLGWYDAEMTAATSQNKVWGANEDYYFYTHTQPYGGTRTLIALWARDTEPTASITMEQNDEQKQYTYIITATDEVAVKAVKYLIADADAEVTTSTEGWSEPLVLTENTGSFSIPFINEYLGKHVYVLVENEGNSTIVRDEDYIRSFTTLTANPDPDSANGTLVETDREDKDHNTIYEFRRDGTYRDYYCTYYHSGEAYKLHDVTAYKVHTINDNKTILNLTEIKANDNGEVILPKGEAVILKAGQRNIMLEKVLSDEQRDEENILQGVDDDSSQGYGSYYKLTYAQHGLGFYMMDEGEKLAAHKAFFILDDVDPTEARAFTFNFYEEDNNNTTGIEEVVVEDIVEKTEAESDALYDLSGRKVSAPSAQGGIYIMGGKKVFIKK